MKTSNCRTTLWPDAESLDPGAFQMIRVRIRFEGRQKNCSGVMSRNSWNTMTSVAHPFTGVTAAM